MGNELRMERDSATVRWACRVLLGLMKWADAHSVRLNGTESAIVFAGDTVMLTGVKASSQGACGYLDGAGYMYVGDPFADGCPVGTKLD